MTFCHDQIAFVSLHMLYNPYQTNAASPWTETVKRQVGGEWVIEPRDVLTKFQPYADSLQSQHPHDHAMLFTL